jgi:hypothetical protein
MPLTSGQITFTAGAVFDTRGLAAAATIGVSTNFILTAGYTSVGDGGAARYIRAGGTTAGGFQSADGAWWALNERFVSFEMFGARGDGSTDDTAAWVAAWTFIGNRGGGYLFGTPAHTYKLDTTSIIGVQSALVFVNTFLQNAGLINATISCPTSYVGHSGQINYLVWFGGGGNNLIFENVNLTVFAEDPDSTTEFRGVSSFVFSGGFINIAGRNINQVGGRHLFWHAPQNANFSDFDNEVTYQNINTANTHYPIQLIYSRNVKIFNLRADKAARVLFLRNVQDCIFDVWSTNNAADDILLIAEGSNSYITTICCNVRINYKKDLRTFLTPALDPCITFVMTSDTTAGALMQNVQINFDISGVSALPLYAIQNTRALAAGGNDVGPARGHVMENITISGRIDAQNASSPIVSMGSGFPVGEKFSNINYKDLVIHATGTGGLSHDTTALVGRMTLDNVQIDGGIGFGLAGTPAGTIFYNNFIDPNGALHFRVMEASGGSYIFKHVLDDLAVAIPTYTVAALPSAASTLNRAAFVTDATATTFASIVAGGGGNHVPVWSNGTNWLIG